MSPIPRALTGIVLAAGLLGGCARPSDSNPVSPPAPAAAGDGLGTVATHMGRGGGGYWPICITSNDGNYTCTTCQYQGGSTATTCIPRIPAPPTKLP